MSIWLSIFLIVIGVFWARWPEKAWAIRFRFAVRQGEPTKWILGCYRVAGMLLGSIGVVTALRTLRYFNWNDLTEFFSRFG